MNILFIHQNFPGQFKHLAPLLAARGHHCLALTLKVKEPTLWKNVRVVPYDLPKRTAQNVHPWLLDLDSKVTRAEGCFRAARKLRDQGYKPDLILGHPGWGETMFLRDAWPEAKLALYCELYYQDDNEHLNFDPEFAMPDEEVQRLRIRMKNLNTDMHVPQADAGLSPTLFQASTYPKDMRDKITVCHDGIDTSQLKPNPNALLNLDGLSFSNKDEIITYVSRNLEPMRGYHVFMRALPKLLKDRPDAQVLIVGGDGTSYGAKPATGTSWKKTFIDEVRPQISEQDWTRVHHLGRIPYDQFITLLQVSRVHVYLSQPFVLSWSLMEAMACEAAIVASDTAPVREVIAHGKEGQLVNYFDTDALLSKIYTLLDDAAMRRSMGQTAREKIKKRYDLNAMCLPKQLEWLSQAMSGARI